MAEPYKTNSFQFSGGSLTEKDVMNMYQRVMKTAPPRILDEILVSRAVAEQYLFTLGDGRKVLAIPEGAWLRFCHEQLTDADRFQANAHGTLWGIKITWAGTLSGDDPLTCPVCSEIVAPTETGRCPKCGDVVIVEVEDG